MTVNKSLELQKLIIQSLKNIDFFKENNIGCFASVPFKMKTPYIKIYGLTKQQNQNACNINTYTVDLFVATHWKNNSQILDIMENIENNICIKINQFISNNSIYPISVYNVYNTRFDVKEDLQNNIWSGHFYLDIDIL